MEDISKLIPPLNMEDISNWLLAIASFLLVIATGCLVKATNGLKNATDGIRESSDTQITAGLIKSFQDKWHDRIFWLMRECLNDKSFLKCFDDSVGQAYRKRINRNEIEKLLEPPVVGSEDLEERLQIFKEGLKRHIFHDTTTRTPLFTGYEALELVLLEFDRLALLPTKLGLFEKAKGKEIIKDYKPPIEALSGILQAFIAVSKYALQPKDKRNYKKDYMRLLADPELKLANLNLFTACKEGLIAKNALTEEEKKKWEELLDTIKKNTVVKI